MAVASLSKLFLLQQNLVIKSILGRNRQRHNKMLCPWMRAYKNFQVQPVVKMEINNFPCDISVGTGVTNTALATRLQLAASKPSS